MVLWLGWKRNSIYREHFRRVSTIVDLRCALCRECSPEANDWVIKAQHQSILPFERWWVWMDIEVDPWMEKAEWHC